MREKSGMYIIDKCKTKGTETPSRSHGFFHGGVVTIECSRETAERALNSSIITNTVRERV